MEGNKGSAVRVYAYDTEDGTFDQEEDLFINEPLYDGVTADKMVVLRTGNKALCLGCAGTMEWDLIPRHMIRHHKFRCVENARGCSSCFKLAGVGDIPANQHYYSRVHGDIVQKKQQCFCVVCGGMVPQGVNHGCGQQFVMTFYHIAEGCGDTPCETEAYARSEQAVDANTQSYKMSMATGGSAASKAIQTVSTLIGLCGQKMPKNTGHACTPPLCEFHLGEIGLKRTDPHPALNFVQSANACKACTNAARIRGDARTRDSQAFCLVLEVGLIRMPEGRKTRALRPSSDRRTSRSCRQLSN